MKRWRQALEAAYRDAPWDHWVQNDPLCFVRRYSDPRDQEIAGMVAAGLAYGRVGCILPSVARVLDAMDDAPHAFLTRFHPERYAGRFTGFAHRFHTADAIVAMLSALQHAVQEHGSLGALFAHGHSPRARDTQAGLARFVEALRGYTEAERGPWDDNRALYGWRHFLASPRDGSACKRLNLYLRWMVRTGVPDVGAWPDVSPRQLLVPVDVHVAAIARRMEWTARASADIKMAVEITAVLRRLDRDDPTRFDFVLSHLGMDRATGRLTRAA